VHLSIHYEDMKGVTK